MKFYINPSNQPGNLYCKGNTNERDNMRIIAALTADALRRCGQEVRVGTGMESGVSESNAWGADVHVPMHSNAANGKARGARVFYGTAEDKAKIVWGYLDQSVGGQHVAPTKQTNLYEIRNTNAECIYIEAAFHDNPDDCDLLLHQRDQIAETTCRGLCGAYGIEYVPPGTAVLDAAKEGKFTMEDAQNWAVAAGLFRGDDNGKMNWKEPLTRSQAAMLLYRFYKGFIKTLG